MLFTTIERYNKELEDMKLELKETKEYLENHPEKHGTRGNYNTLKYLYNLFNQDKIDFIKEMNNFNLKLVKINDPISIKSVYELNKKFNNITNAMTNLIENTNNIEELHLKSIAEGSYKITFAFKNPTEEDVKRLTPRKKGLMKIFDLMNCGDDIEKLKSIAGPDGQEALIAYQEFLTEIIKLNSDFTLDTEMENVKSSLTFQQCKNICENLNV